MGKTTFKRLAVLDVMALGSRRGRISAQLADRLPRAARGPLNLHLGFAAMSVKPAAVVEALAVLEHDASDLRRRGKRHGVPVFASRSFRRK